MALELQFQTIGGTSFQHSHQRFGICWNFRTSLHQRYCCMDLKPNSRFIMYAMRARTLWSWKSDELNSGKESVTKYKCSIIQTEHNTNETKCKHDKMKNSKIQTWQNTKGQNTNCQNTNVTRYKWNKIQQCQIQNETKYNKIQNTTKYKQDKIQKNKIQYKILC